MFKRSTKFWGGILLALALSCALGAQSADSNSAVGTWKLNVSKSKFNPAVAAPKSATVTIGEDRKISVREVGEDGTERNYSFTPIEGTAVPVEGMEGTTITEKRVDDRTVEHIWKMSDSTMTGRATISQDGKTMTYDLTGAAPDGTAVHNVEIYERQ